MLVRHRFWSCVSLAVVACPARSPAAFTSDPTVAADVQRGRKLTDAAAAQLEDAVVRHPDDAAARAQLLGYYFDRSAAFPQRRLAHVVWMIRHRPADPLTPAYGAFSPLADAPGYAAAAAAWDEQVAAHPADAAVLADAADFYDHPGDTGADAAKARDLLGRATAAEPKAFDWPARLAASLERQADREPASAPALCGQALQLRQSAYKLAPTRTDRFHVLLNEPADCYRTGDLIATKRLAQRLLDAADDFPPTRPTPTPSTRPTSPWARWPCTRGTSPRPTSTWPPPPRTRRPRGCPRRPPWPPTAPTWGWPASCWPPATGRPCGTT